MVCPAMRRGRLSQTAARAGRTVLTGRIYDGWMKDLGVMPSDAIVVSNLVALTGLTVSGLGVSYLPRQCLQPLVDAGLLAVIDVLQPLPPVPYVAMHKGEHRSALTASIIMLAQSCCDFTRVFQAMTDDAVVT
jgi:DNA-binding transcriptional LysR family regulator